MASTSTTRCPRAGRRDKIRHELLGAFERLIAEGETFSSLSVDRLATEAGISRSTFYVYFEDKGDLLAALAGDVIDELVAAAAAWWSLARDIDRDALDTALRGVADVYITHQAVLAAVVESASTDPRVREIYRALLAQTVGNFEAHIRRGQEHGSVTTDLTPEHAAGWLTWMTERGLAQIVAPAAPDRRERATRALADVVWNSLYRDAA